MCDKKLVHCNWTLLKTHSPNLHDIPTFNTHNNSLLTHRQLRPRLRPRNIFKKLFFCLNFYVDVAELERKN